MKKLLRIKKIVLDPVMVAKGGTKLIDKEAIKFLKKNLIHKVSLITPVPGGVGPMTIACLMYNTVKASFIRNGHDFKEIIFDE